MSKDLQTLSVQNKLAQCRDSGMSAPMVSGDGINISSYYKWQRKVYVAARAQQESCFVEVTPVVPVAVGSVAVTVRIAGAELNVHNGADAASVEAAPRAVKSC